MSLGTDIGALEVPSLGGRPYLSVFTVFLNSSRTDAAKLYHVYHALEHVYPFNGSEYTMYQLCSHPAVGGGGLHTPFVNRRHGARVRPDRSAA